jgi:hypothetical protein
MEALSQNRGSDPAAELKLLIIRQHELAVRLVREGKRSRARDERAKLLTLINRLELIEHAASD